jgi:hypothetical protein
VSSCPAPRCDETMTPVDAASNPFKISRRFHRGVMGVEYPPAASLLETLFLNVVATASRVRGL